MLPNEHITTVGDIKGIYSVGDLTVSSGEDVQRFYRCVLFCFSVEECSSIALLSNGPYPIVAWSDVVNLFKREVLSRSSLPSFISISCLLYRSLWCRKYIYIWWVLGKLSWHTVTPFHFHFSSVSGHYVMERFILILSWSWTVIRFTVFPSPFFSICNLNRSHAVKAMARWCFLLCVCMCLWGFFFFLLFSANLPVIVVSLETCFCQQKIKAAESSLSLEILPICRLPASKPVNSALWTGTGSAC